MWMLQEFNNIKTKKIRFFKRNYQFELLEVIEKFQKRVNKGEII